MNIKTKLLIAARYVRFEVFPIHMRIRPVVLLVLMAAARPASAATYYFDNDSSNPGFGTAGGTWAAPTPGPIPGWSIDATGSSVPASITTALADTLNFGNGTTGLGAGTITLSGALNAGSINFAAGSGAINLSGGTSLTLTASPTITVNNISDTIASVLAGAGTTFTKAGTGTLILSGQNTISGAVTINSGELQINNGSLNVGAKAISLASGTSQTAVLNLVSGGITNATSNPIGSGAGAVGVFKMSGGNYIMTAGNFNVGGGAAGRVNYSAFLMSGGFASVGGEVDLARDSTTASTYVNISGGFFVCSNYATVGREGFGVLDISGGTFLRPFTAVNKFYMGRSAGSFSQINLRGTGAIDFEDGGFFFANSATPVFSGMVNLMTGGKLTSRVGLIWGANAGTIGYLNFNGGTLQASGPSATFWPNSWTAAYVFGGGAIVDSQANNITIGQPLLAPAGNGVTSITGGTGSGFLAPPVVAITGDGTGATAVAQIDSGGNVTNILITSPGVNYSTATVTLTGSGTASGWTANFGANVTTGGLTKLGSGTLTLSGANTYQGPTKVGGGTLALTASIYPSASVLTLSNTTALNLDVSSGANTLATPSLVLGTNSTLNLSYGTLGGNPFQPAISDPSINTGTVLTANGTNIVINLSGSGFTSGQFPLIKYSGSIGGIGFAAFKLGTRPSGVPATAQLVNNTANGSIDLSIPLVNSLTWNGANVNWDTTTVNWKDALSNPSTYKEYGTTNIYGDLVTFDDSLSDPSKNSINLTTTLHPSSVTVSAGSVAYSFGGSGKLSGSSFLNVSGGATLTIDTTNDYTGGSTLAAGTVLIGNNAALGGGPIALAGSILSSDSAAARTLTNAVGITVDTAFGTGASSGTLTLAGPVDLGGVPRGLSLDNNVALTGPVSDGSISKSGAGTLTVDNTGTSLSGVTTVNAGKVTLNNGVFSGAFNIAPGFGQSGVIEIGNANITNSAQNNVAASGSTLGVIKQSGGNFVETGTMVFGTANSDVSAAYLMSGGFASFGGDTRLDNSGSVGLITQSGGSMVSLNFFTIDRDGGLGVYDLSGGTHFRPASATNQMYLGTRANGGNAQLTVRGTGVLDIEDSSGLWFDHSGARNLQAVGMVNLLNGGTLISRTGIFWGNVNAGSVGYVNFNGGKLVASGSATDFWSGWTAGYIFGGGAVIDSQSNSISIGQALLPATGGGVTAITGGSGSGYLSPPVVTISGDGSGATAVAQIDSNGNVTNVFITNPGVNYTGASANFSGGGGSGGGYSVSIGANTTTGGLTKMGSGTLTLTGTNSYNGLTAVNNGTLVLGQAFAATGGIAVADGKTLGCLSDSPGVTVHLAAATLGVSTGAGLLAQFTGITANPTAVAGYITNLTLNGATPVSVLCSGIQVGTIPLFQYSTISGAGSITTGTLPQGVAGTITNNTTTKTISLVVTGFIPLVWSGANSNSWDINVTTNWLLGATPSTYQDGASVVLFNDTAVNGNVLINQAVNPQSVVFSNNTVTYNVGTSAAGVLGGTTGLTKNGSGTVILSGTNSYTGVTVINAGTLQIGNGDVSGILGAAPITVGANGTLAYNTSTILNGILNNISGTGTINKDGAQMGWSGTNTFSGTINVVGGKLAFSGADSEDGQPNVNITAGAVISIGASFAGGTATLGNLTGAGAIDAAFGAMVGTRTLQVNQTANGVYSGPMTDSSAGRVLALVKTGPATLTFSGTNIISGGTVVSNGTLIFSGALISNSVVTVSPGAAFGGSATVAGIVSYSAGSIATNNIGAPMTVSTLDMAGNAALNVGTASPLSAGSYPLINYATLTSGGQFTSVSVGGAGLAVGASASVGMSNGVVSLNVVGGAPPAATITYTVNGNQLVLNWPTGQGWQLQSQTNGLNTGLGTNWVTIGAAVPPFTNVVTPVNPVVFYRLKQ